MSSTRTAPSARRIATVGGLEAVPMPSETLIAIMKLEYCFATY